MSTQYQELVEQIVIGALNTGVFTDGVANSTTTWQSASATFVAADVGREIIGAGIPAGTTIASRSNATTVILNAAATVTGSSKTFIIIGRNGTFRHDDSGDDSETDCIIVRAAGATAELVGPQGYRFDVTIDIHSKTSEANAATIATVLERLTSSAIVRAAALAAGLTTGDDLYLFTEEMSGDREFGHSLRKRSLSLPVLINKH